MSTPRHERVTTADSYAAKRNRVTMALTHPEMTDKPNRELARLLEVDEAMIRKYRKMIFRGKVKRKRPAAFSEPKRP